MEEATFSGPTRRLLRRARVRFGGSDVAAALQSAHEAPLVGVESMSAVARKTDQGRAGCFAER